MSRWFELCVRTFFFFFFFFCPYSLSFALCEICNFSLQSNFAIVRVLGYIVSYCRSKEFYH